MCIYGLTRKTSCRRISICIALTSLVLVTSLSNPFSVHGQKWNVNYANPERYLVPGEQSRISSEQTINALKVKLGQRRGLEGLRDLYLWIRQDFSVYSGGGATVGKVTIGQLLGTKNLSGCHDFGLVFSGVARYLGYPAIMVDAAGLAWAEQFKAGKVSSYSGHVFVEVYLSQKWILVDSTSGEFVREYQPANPVIPVMKRPVEEKGYFAILKGIDMREYGVKEPEALLREMRSFANSVDLDELEIPSYVIERLASIASGTATSSSVSAISTDTVVTPRPKTPTYVGLSWPHLIALLVVLVASASLLLARKYVARSSRRSLNGRRQGFRSCSPHARDRCLMAHF